MSPAKKPTKPRTGSKTAARKATSKKTTKTTARKSAKKPVAKKTSKKTAAKKTAARRKTTAKKAPAKKTAARKKPTAKKTPAKKAPAKKSATSGKKKTVTKAPAKKSTASKTPEAPPEKPVKQPLIRRAAPKPVPAKRVRPAKLSAEDLKRIQAQLEEERTDLERQLDELQGASFQGSQSDLTGEVGLDEDFADAGTATFDRERDLSIRNNIRDLIDQINRALSRIADGGYGTCERCGNPIDASRLKALPHASLCLDCKRREERVR